MRYFKPKSLTWWAGFVPLLAGLTLMLEPLTGVSALSAAVNSAYPDASAADLINVGLIAIGLRGAVRE